MIQTLRNAWKIPELRKKILYTLFVLVIFRLGSSIPVPFINVTELGAYFDALSASGTALNFINVFTGGGLSQATIFAMSITPYINASIIMQLLTIAVPALERMNKEGGEEGRKKIASITRYVAVLIGLIQGYSYYLMLRTSSGYQLLENRGVWAGIVIVLTFTAGTALLMWLGEHITEKGVGNGISIILFAGILSRVPTMVVSLYQMLVGGVISWFVLVLVLLMGLFMIAFVVFMSNAERRIPVQYAKRVVGRKMYGGQSTHLPVKVSASGVMPVIFASSILSLPATIGMFHQPTSSWGQALMNMFTQTHPVYIVVYILLIFGFSYFYASVQFNPVEIGNNLKNNGGFIPGFRPGKPTTDFIVRVLNKVTFLGAIFLCVVAALPLIIGAFNSSLNGIALGGTSLLIVVGVALETVKQIEAQMMMRHYKGFLE